MNKVANILINFGMGFHYENRGSEGESILSYECDLELFCRNGKFLLNSGSDTHQFNEDERGEKLICELVENICIEETT